MIDDMAHIDEIDANRFRRARELSELKVRIAMPAGVTRYGVHSKAVIVLSYAHWEGFYNECVHSYINSLKGHHKKVCDVAWSMMIGLLKPELQRLRDRNSSREAESDFVDKLNSLLSEGFDGFDISVVSSRSNLDFEKLRHNFRVLGFDPTPFQRWRLHIDKELVGWRHSVAHGNDPDLSSVDLNHHIVFTQKMLLLLADVFQNEMIKKLENDRP
jgi:hypothetical protein